MELPDWLKFKNSRRQIISLDFGSAFIKLAHLEARGGKFALLGYALEKINSPGETSQELSAQLRQILAAHSITTKTAYLNIFDAEQILIKKLTLPQMSRNELIDAIKWQLKGEFTFIPGEDVFDLQVIREYADSEGAKKIELFCIFAKRELINKYLGVAAACGLACVKVSTSVFNYSTILDALGSDLKASAILDIGHTQSQLLIYQNNKLNFVRNLNFSTSKLSAALISSLLTDKGRVEINLEKARQLIRQHGIVLNESANLEEGIRANQVIPLIRPLLEILTKELERSFDFLKSESAFDDLAVLYLTGGGANLKNLNSYLAGSLKLRVEELPFPDAIDLGEINPEQFSLDANQLSGALGLGLAAAGINLLPPEVKSQKVELVQKSSLRILAIVIGAIFIFSWFVVSFQIRDYQQRLKIAQAHLQGVGEIKILKQTVDLRQDYLNEIYVGRIPPVGLLKLISAVIPPSIILEEFNFDQASQRMRISGMVGVTRESIERVLTDFMHNLESSKFVLDASLVSSKSDQGVHTFEIECQLVK